MELILVLCFQPKKRYLSNQAFQEFRTRKLAELEYLMRKNKITRLTDTDSDSMNNLWYSTDSGRSWEKKCQVTNNRSTRSDFIQIIMIFRNYESFGIWNCFLFWNFLDCRIFFFIEKLLFSFLISGVFHSKRKKEEDFLASAFTWHTW